MESLFSPHVSNKNSKACNITRCTCINIHRKLIIYNVPRHNVLNQRRKVWYKPNNMFARQQQATACLHMTFQTVFAIIQFWNLYYYSSSHTHICAQARNASVHSIFHDFHKPFLGKDKYITSHQLGLSMTCYPKSHFKNQRVTKILVRYTHIVMRVHCVCGKKQSSRVSYDIKH